MRVELSAQRLTFPPQCACCSGQADGVLVASATRYRGKRVVNSTTREWQFPYCRKCLAHVQVYNSAAALGLLVGLGALLLALMAAWAVLIGIAAAIGIVAWRRRAAADLCGPTCVQAGPAVHFVAWQGPVQVFEVASRAYAGDFLRANDRKAVNLSEEARATLVARPEAGREPARAATRAEAKEPRPADSGAELLKWIAKLESLTGPASRRAALDAGLKSLTSPGSRERLLLEASRIEVDAVLSKVDGLKTPAAKRRNLLAALEALRADDVADELQRQQIEWLEAALRELEPPSVPRPE